MSLEEQISNLSDDDAVETLRRFANAQIPQDVPRSIDSSLARQMLAEVDVSDADATRPSDGGLARAALAVVAQDETHREGIEAMLRPKNEQFVRPEDSPTFKVSY